ncbi:MAG: DoxX family protein [Acidobacteria bacterium]|nr:DoxX family protein [Acidobacteriota bacterium]
MQDSMAQASSAASFIEIPAWKNIIAWICAVLIGIFFIGAGLWKLTDHLGAATRMSQMLVPASLSVFAALFFGISETLGGLLLMVPRYRRWGALLCSALLVAFMVYMGWNYKTLQGLDCTCFPWLKRAVGPAFFWSDGAMIVMAVLAGWWAHRSEGLKGAGLILGSILVLAGAAFGITESRQSGTPAPASITVEGQPYSLQQGKVLLYFYDPECSHCNDAAKRMAKHIWKDVKIVGLPTRVPQFGQYFMESTGLRGKNSPDHVSLKALFPFGDPPYGVLLEYGRMKTGLQRFDDVEPEATLRKYGFIE